MQENDPKSPDSATGIKSELLPTMMGWWSEILKLPSVGPIYAFSKDFQSYADDFIELGRVVSEMKTNLEQYWSLMNEAYSRATRETFEKSPKQIASKEDFEQYRRAMIEAFEEAYTELFGSSKFSEIYGKVFSNQLDVSRAMQSIAERNLKILNIPTRGELDEVLQDIHELKKSVRELKKFSKAVKSYESTRSAQV